MKNNGTASQGQKLEMAAAMVRHTPELDQSVIQYWITHQAELGNKIREALLNWFPVWKTIILSTTGEKLDLVLVSVRDLGFTTRVRYEDVCAKGRRLGLELCLQEEFLDELEVQYRDRPVGEEIKIAETNDVDSDDYIHIGYLGRNSDGKFTRGWSRDKSAEKCCQPNDKFVFVKK